MPKQDCAAAGRRLDECGECVQPFALVLATSRLDLSFDPLPRSREILRAPEQPCFGRLAVAPGPPRLLVISLDRLGDSGMGDETNVGLVDAHAERDRRRDHHVLGLDKRRLVARSDLRFEPGVIGRCLPSVRRQLLGDLLGLVAARRIDDPGSVLRPSSIFQLP